MNKSHLTHIALAILRVVVGLIFAAHGFQKFNEFTIPGTQAAFAQMGVPAAQLVAPAVATLEAVGGIALIAGIGTRLLALLLTFDMIGAIFLVHASAGFFASNGGIEFVLALAGASFAIALAGAGRFSVDARVFGRLESRLSLLA